MTPLSALTQYHKGVPDIDAEWFLASDFRHYDFDAFYQGWWNVPAGLRAADVVIVGNSRSLWGFRQQFLEPYFESLGLRAFSLDFPGDGTARQIRAILERLDVRPRLLIINSEPEMFGPAWGVNMIDTAARSRWQSCVHFHEAQAAWWFRKRLHLLVPPLQTYLLKQEDLVSYRSSRNGAIRWFGHHEDNVPFRVEDPPDFALARRMFDDEESGLQSFVEAMRARGTSIILTLVPYPRYQYLAVPITALRAERWNLPYVPILMDGLSGRDTTHLDTRSGAVVAARLVDGLLKVREFRQLVPSGRLPDDCANTACIPPPATAGSP